MGRHRTGFYPILIVLLFVSFTYQGDVARARDNYLHSSFGHTSSTTNVFPPIGHFVTHQFPPATRINISTTGDIYAYGYATIHKSSDYGYMWQLLIEMQGLNTGGMLWVFEPSPNISEDHTLFLGINYGTDALRVSLDEGKSWELPADSITGPVMSIAFSPNYANDDIMYLSTRSASGIYLYRSVDKGQHWQGISYPGSEAIKKVLFSPNYIYDKTIFFLTDLGNLWKLVESPSATQVNRFSPLQPAIFTNDFILSPNYGVDSTIFLATSGGVFASYNGGEGWTYLASPAFDTISIAPNYPANNMLFGSNMSSGMRTTNGGKNWQTVISTGVYSFEFSPNFLADSIVYANAKDGLRVSIDRGASWFVQSPTLPSSLETFELSSGFSVDSTVFVGPLMQEQGKLYRSTDGGTNFTELSTPQVGAPVFTLSGTYPFDHTIFVSFGNILYVSTNGGDQWTQLSVMPANATILRTSPHFSSDHTIFMASYGTGIFRSTTGGSTWDNITGPLNIYAIGLEISADFPDPPTLFVYDNGFYRSDTAGDSWIKVEPNMSSVQPLVQPGLIFRLSPSFMSDQTIFYQSSYSVYRSTNGGSSWTNISDNLFPGNPNALVISPQYKTDQTLMAASEGNYLYFSQDAGDDWFRLRGIPQVGRYGVGLGYDSSGKIVPIASAYYGIYRYIWQEKTPLIPSAVRTYALKDDVQPIQRNITFSVVGDWTPGLVLSENADWLEITNISGTLPLAFGFIFDTSQLVDKLETTISADVYWSAYDFQHYEVPVVLTRVAQLTMLPVISRR